MGFIGNLGHWGNSSTLEKRMETTIMGFYKV